MDLIFMLSGEALLPEDLEIGSDPLPAGLGEEAGEVLPVGLDEGDAFAKDGVTLLQQALAGTELSEAPLRTPFCSQF